MNIVAILQARVSSSRLPKKVLKPILSKPMLQWQIERLSQSRLISKLIVATSNQAEDQPIVSLCEQLNVASFTGNLTNVLDRFYQCAQQEQADIVVRLTGDCPLIDAEVVDQVIDLHIKEKADYCSNVEPATFPDGLDVEVFNFALLKSAWLSAKKQSDLEHVTPYIRNNLANNKRNLTSTINYAHYRWTVDEPNDFTFVEKVFKTLADKNPHFSRHDVYQLLEQHPNWLKINSQITRNEGYLHSLTADKEK